VWTLIRREARWSLFVGSAQEPATIITLDQETAWKLFSKGLDGDSAWRRIQFQGNPALGEPVLGSLAVMA